MPLRPKYLHLVTALRERIVNGSLAPGTRLPGIRALRTQYHACANTVLRAVDDLCRMGFIEVRDRTGVFVVLQPPHRHRFALLLPFHPSHETSEEPIYFRLLRAEALRWRVHDDTVVPFTIHPGQGSSHPDHQRLLDELGERRLAGLIMPTSPADHPWFDPGAWHLPCLSGQPASPRTGRLELSLQRWVDIACRQAAQQGRRRAAVILSSAHEPRESLAWIGDIARRAGLDCPPWRTQVCNPLFPHFTRNLVHLLFQPGQSAPPEALLVANDNMAEAAAMGLIDAGCGDHPPELIVHANFPSPPICPLPCHFLGWDIPTFLGDCLASLSAWREGGPPPRTVQPDPRWQEG